MNAVLIRPLEEHDAAVSWKWRNDADVWKYTGSRPDKVITYEIELEWIRKVIKEDSSRRFAIIVDGVYVGNVQLTNIDKSKGTFHIFIGDKNFWGKGLSKLATYQLLYYARESLKLESVLLEVHSENIAAIRSYKSVGFEVTDKIINDGYLSMKCDLQELPDPVVSIFVMVYNHGRFLKECIEGLLMQRCAFNFEIVIGEDCSSDDSRSILLEYQRRYPGKFKLLLHNENIGANRNQEIVLENCQGKYIAICEGDDYWTDADKLQKQIDILESHENIMICATNYNIFNNDTSYYERANMFSEKKEISFNDLLETNCIGTLTAVFRNLSPSEWEGYNNVTKDINLLMGDYPLWLYLMRDGAKAILLPDNTANYRVLSESASHTQDKEKAKRFALNVLDIQLYFGLKVANVERSVIKTIIDRALMEAYIYEDYRLYKNYYKLLIENNFNASISQRLKGIFLPSKQLTYLIKKTMRLMRAGVQKGVN